MHSSCAYATDIFLKNNDMGRAMAFNMDSTCLNLSWSNFAIPDEINYNEWRLVIMLPQKCHMP